jgi:CRP-like cAMP-binding protein
MLAILGDPQLLRSGIAERCEYDSGETIIVEGSVGRSLYLVEHGSVRVLERVELEDRRHIQPGLCDLGPGEVFGELSLFEAVPRSASVIAIEPCRLLVFDTLALTERFSRQPEIGYLVLKELFNILTDRLRQADRRLGLLFAWGLKAHGIDRHL